MGSRGPQQHRDVTPPRGWWLAALVAAVPIALLSATSTALASEWTKAQRLGPDERVRDVDVAIGKREYALVGWQAGSLASSRAMIATRSPGRARFSRPRALGTTGSRSAKVGIAHGAHEGFVAWAGDGSVNVRRHSPRKGFRARASFPIADGSRALSLDLAVARNGFAALQWRDGDRHWVAIREPGRRFGTPILVGEGPWLDCWPVSVASPGWVAVGCGRYPPAEEPEERRPDELFVLVRPPGGPAFQRHDVALDVHGFTDLVVTERGKVVALMSEGASEPGCVRAAVKRPGRPFTPPRLISDCVDNEYYGALGADRRGRVVAGWTALVPRYHPFAALLPRHRGWRKPRRVGPFGMALVDLAVAPAGTTAIALRGDSVGAVVARPSALRGRVERVSRDGARGAHATIAVNNGGKAIAAWALNDVRGPVRVASRR